MAKATKKTAKKAIAKKTPAKKPVAKKIVAKKTPMKKAVAKKVIAKKATAKKPAVKKTSRKKVVTPEERYCMLQDASYYIAERNGFGGANHRYWVEAEKEIDAIVVTK